MAAAGLEVRSRVGGATWDPMVRDVPEPARPAPPPRAPPEVVGLPPREALPPPHPAPTTASISRATSKGAMRLGLISSSLASCRRAGHGTDGMAQSLPGRPRP